MQLRLKLDNLKEAMSKNVHVNKKIQQEFSCIL